MYITTPQRKDGFGGQFVNLIRSIVFIEVNGHTFVDTGINSMTIQDADEDPKYFSKLLNYMNINKFYLTPSDLPAGTEIHSLPNVIEFYHSPYPEFSDTYYSEFCEKIRNEYKGPKPLRFHIYSLGKEDDFSFLKGNDILFHLNADLIQTHLGFIFADVLLISHSCLSYSAAFFSKGIIYYREWNHLHLGLPSWIRYD